MRLIPIAFMALVGVALAAEKAPPTVRVYIPPTLTVLTIFSFHKDMPASKKVVLETARVASAWYVGSPLFKIPREIKLMFYTATC